MEADGDHFLAYYLTKEDEAAIQFKQNRLAREPDAPPEDEPTYFHFVRDYETTKVEQDITNEFILNVDDGDDFDDVKPGQQSRGKGAYYKNIERKMTLNKRRANVRTDTLCTLPSCSRGCFSHSRTTIPTTAGMSSTSRTPSLWAMSSGSAMKPSWM